MDVRISDIISSGGYSQADSTKIINLLKKSRKYNDKVKTGLVGTVVEGELTEIIEEVDRLMDGNVNSSASTANTFLSNSQYTPLQKSSFTIQTDNTIGKILQMIGYIIIVLGVIGSIILGSTADYYGFNLYIFLIGILSTSLSGLLIVSLGEIINILHHSREYLRTIAEGNNSSDKK